MELITTIIASALGPIGGVLLFLPIYHPLHDSYNIHSEVTFMIIFTVFAVLIWSGDRAPKQDFTKTHKIKTHWTTVMLVSYLVLHYTVFWIMPIFFNPENEISTGIREQIGPCNEHVPIQTISGKVDIDDIFLKFILIINF